MSFLLNANQLAEAAEQLELKEALAVYERASEALAETIATKLGVSCGGAHTEAGFGGLCVAFYAAEKGQACPEELQEYDDVSEWDDLTEEEE